MMFGDGYTNDAIAPFVKFLESHGIKTIGIPLLEEEENTSYSDITPENYCKYIDSFIPRFCNDLCLYGISKGCEWLMIYASRRSNVKKLILVEPTTFPGKPEYLVEFEKDRGNDYVEDYYQNEGVDEQQDNAKMTLDAIASDRHHYYPKCPINIVWTARNNQNEAYSPQVIQMKHQYVNYLRSHGCKVRVFEKNSDHCIDTHEQHFPFLLRVITEV